MKMKKILALGMSLAMVLGAVACSSDKTDETTAGTTAAPAETTAAPQEPEETKEEPEETTAAPEETASSTGTLEGFTDLGKQEATNEGDGKILVWSWNTEVKEHVEKYSNVDFDFEEVGGGDQPAFRTALDQALASGDEAPDVYATDASWAQHYLKSDNSLAINTLGIDYGDLTNMYKYTLEFAADDEGVLKGLAWQACPCGIYYNTELAKEYLGVDAPEDVAPFFATWDAFLQTAKDVNEKSEGKVKAISGYDDVWQSYLNRRTSGWIVDGALNIDSNVEGYFDMAKQLHDDGLTFDTTQWTDPWTNNVKNSSVLSYWGPMWLGQYSLAMADESNPTYGQWKMVNSPSPWYWGGTWLMASGTCDMKADAGQIMYDVCANQDNLKAMAKDGEFVNSIPVMTEVANDPSFGLDWLGGQNPFSILLDTASTIDNSMIGVNDGAINDLFTAAVGSYVSGDVETVAEAKASFEAAVKDANILD